MLTALTNCSVSDFLIQFNLLVQQAKVKAFETDTLEGSTLEQVK